MPTALEAIRSSVNRLGALVRPLTDQDINRPAYPTEWSIADVMSHLGSGAVIFGRRVSDSLAGETTPEDFNQGVWDEWNAKSPRAKTDEGMDALESFSRQIEAVSENDRARMHTTMGPFELDWNSYLGMRLNEQLLHEWDIAVAFNPAEVLGPDGTALVIDNLELIGKFAAKPNGESGSIVIATVAPDRVFSITIKPDTVIFGRSDRGVLADISMPSEALIRLVYGRLDPEHTPATVSGSRELLDTLRTICPGV